MSKPDWKVKREDVWRKHISLYDIRDIVKSDKTPEELAGLYKVTIQTINHIRRHYTPNED